MTTYCCSDLHGNKILYDKICDYIKPDDRVIFLGDAGDRGPHSWELIKAIYENPQFTYLCGNHEDMLVKALIEHKENNYCTQEYYHLEYNGGAKTFSDFLEEDPDEQDKWIKKLSNLPLVETYHSPLGVTCELSHAGFTPGTRLTKEELLWDRKHIFDEAEWDENIYVIHGHTPISYIRKEMHLVPSITIQSFKYGCNCKKICIDSKTYETNFIILFNLDTFEEIIIEGV